MPQFDETHVKIQGCIVVWDGVNHPEPPNDNGNIKRALKVVINPNNPDIGVLSQLANDELMRSEFKGVLPQGGYMPIGTAGQQEFNGMYPGWAVVNCSTFKMPDIYNEQGQMLTDPMQYSAMIYPGQIVDVLVNCSVYNNKSKGVAARMDGFMIMVSHNAPRQNFGGGGIDTSGAFGQQQQQGGQQQQQGGQQQQQGGQQQQPPQGGYQQQPPQGGYQQQQGGYQQQPPQGGQQQQPPQGGQQQQQGGYQQQPPQGGQQQQQGGYQQQPPQGGQQQPPQGQYQQQPPQGQQGGPSQAHDYMPLNTDDIPY